MTGGPGSVRGAGGPGAGRRRWLARLSVIPILATLLFVLLYGGMGLGRDTTRGIHDPRSASACQECHAAERHAARRQAEPELCYRCHPEALDHGQSHPLGVRVPSGAAGLPLVGGRLVCTTCHDPHGRPPRHVLLRRTGNDLCLACHRDQAPAHHAGGR